MSFEAGIISHIGSFLSLSLPTYARTIAKEALAEINTGKAEIEFFRQGPGQNVSSIIKLSTGLAAIMSVEGCCFDYNMRLDIQDNSGKSIFVSAGSTANVFQEAVSRKKENLEMLTVSPA